MQNTRKCLTSYTQWHVYGILYVNQSVSLKTDKDSGISLGYW